MSAQQDALFPVRMPLNEQIRHGHGFARHGMSCAKILSGNRGAEFLEVIDQKLLLRDDGLRAARRGPKSHNCLR